MKVGDNVAVIPEAKLSEEDSWLQNLKGGAGVILGFEGDKAIVRWANMRRKVVIPIALLQGIHLPGT